MEAKQQRPESPSEISYEYSDTAFYPFGLYHLIREGQREHISFEKLRSIVVTWAKKVVQEHNKNI